MKKCPQCSRTYTDESLSFCLEDGALLSASYNPIETNTPTVAVNAAEVPTFAASEIPTVVNLSRPTGQTAGTGVGWKVYLAGFVISLIVDVVFFYFLYPYYADATEEIFKQIAFMFDDMRTGFIVAGFILATPPSMIIYALLAFVLGFIWSRPKWRWGFISLIPNAVLTLYYVVIRLSEEIPPPIYFIRLIIANILYLITASLFAYIGSWLSQKIFNKP